MEQMTVAVGPVKMDMRVPADSTDGAGRFVDVSYHPASIVEFDRLVDEMGGPASMDVVCWPSNNVRWSNPDERVRVIVYLPWEVRDEGAFASGDHPALKRIREAKR